MALLGLSARVLPVSMDNAEQILFGTTSLLFPDIIAGLVMAALLSAVMSTVDSILVASALPYLMTSSFSLCGQY